MKRTSGSLTALALLLVTAALAACGGAEDTNSPASGGNSPGGGEATINLVAYSTPEVVYDEIIPGFQKTPDGQGVDFKTSFGASGPSRSSPT
jgi:sulfate transport system substrate-binding protein